MWLYRRSEMHPIELLRQILQSVLVAIAQERNRVLGHARLRLTQFAYGIGFLVVGPCLDFHQRPHVLKFDTIGYTPRRLG